MNVDARLNETWTLSNDKAIQSSYEGVIKLLK